MRIDVKKWVFVGLETSKELFFQKAQDFGIVEFASRKASALHFQHESVAVIMEALKILSRLPETELKSSRVLFESEQTANRVIELWKSHENCLVKIKELEKQQERLTPWGSFSLDSLKKLESSLGYHPTLVMYALDKGFDLAQLVPISEEAGIGYGVWISPKAPAEGLSIFHLEQDPEQVAFALSETQKCYHEVQSELAALKVFQKELEKLLCERLEKIHLEWSKDCSGLALEGKLFYVEGWVPENKKQNLEQLLQETGVWGQLVEIGADEIAPTYLDNGALGQIGQDLVGVYDVPANTDKDPSIWVLGFFALFFSMIISDAGYGLVLLALSLFVHFKYPQLQATALRVKRLAILLSIGCVLWGAVTCSYFGISVAPSHALRQVSLLHQLSLKKVAYHAKAQDGVYRDWVKAMPQLKEVSRENPQKIVEEGFTGTRQNPSYTLLSSVSDSLLKELALLVGALHLILSLARYSLRTWSSWGWMLFIVGGWLYFPSIMKASTFVNYLLGVDPNISCEIGLQIVYIGLFLAFGFSFIQNKIYGFLEIMNLIQVFSDVLSYLRLYALGLAGSIMSATFNDLAQSAGFVPGLLIIGAGHLINLTLGVMGGVVHGLRLNFLEWYHYSFSGAGRWFRPLKKMDESSQ